ncbi:hypothetical protein [Paenibacillus naphthalenovorans]|uniref:hypothetical protein n=1 Tax=Paenibacillus naphthalenovorans TaxID=162209 RepID=UPI003D2E4755
MFKSNFVLSTDEHINAALFNKSKVIVYQDDQIINYGGLIQAQSEHAIKINDEYYLKETCEFRIR